MLREKRFIRSEQVVWETGFLALIQSLGYADALRFLGQLVSGHGDYLAWQDKVFEGEGVAQIYEQAERYWQEKTSDNPPHPSA